MINALSAALNLAGQGIPCFPVLPNKAPACPTGFKAATRDPSALRHIWCRHPGVLVGVPTGDPSGLDALDLDLPKHAEARAWWDAHRDRMPRTQIHRTRSGGLHLLFRSAPGLRCSAGRVVRGLDVRAAGGFIVWWPAAGLAPAVDASPAKWPALLLAELAPTPGLGAGFTAPMLANGDSTRRYAVGALRRGVEQVAAATEGTRNYNLYSATRAMCRFIESGHLTPSEIASALATAAFAAGLNAIETQRTIASALRAAGSA